MTQTLISLFLMTLSLLSTRHWLYCLLRPTLCCDIDLQWYSCIMNLFVLSNRHWWSCLLWHSIATLCSMDNDFTFILDWCRYCSVVASFVFPTFNYYVYCNSNFLMCAYIEYVVFLFSKIYFSNVTQLKGIPVRSGRVKRFFSKTYIFLLPTF